MFFFFLNDPPPPEISTLPLPAALPILPPTRVRQPLQAGELERERDRADHWSIPASALVDRLDRLRRERFVEAAGYAPVRSRAARAGRSPSTRARALGGAP